MKLSEVSDITSSGASFFWEPESLKTFNSTSCPVFAMDVDHDVIEKARAGFKSRKIKANILSKAALLSTSKKLNASTEEVGRSLLRLAALVRDSGDAIIIRDFKDRIIAWNSGAQKMYGYTEAEALGMSLRRLIPKNESIRTREQVRLCMQGKKPALIETRRRAKDGRILDVLLTVTVLQDEKGVPVELAATERDITEQKRADRELRRLHTRGISAQETERKRMARDLHDGVGQILSGVKYRLEALSGAAGLKGNAAAKLLEMEGLLGHAISEVRLVSRNLMPPEICDLGLEPALRTLCRVSGRARG